MAGCLHLLQIWAWEHIHVGRPTLHVPYPAELAGLSVGLRWNEKYVRQQPIANVAVYRNELDGLRQTQVIWEPYSEEITAHLSVVCSIGSDIWLARVPLIGWKRVEWYLPDRVLRQFGLIPRVDIAPVDPTFKRVDGRGKADADWVVYHQSHIASWERRRDCLVKGLDETVDRKTATSQYLRWFRSWAVKVNISEKIGLPSPPPYLAIASSSNNSETLLNGVNFASGGAGILDSTHKGECFSFNKQIDYLSVVYASIVGKVGVAQTNSHLSNSIFIIVIGSNDIFLYLSNKMATPQQFVGSLISTLQLQLQKMYNLGARKFVFVGTGPLGCCPALRSQNEAGDCDDVANYVSDLYNDAASSLLQGMKSQLGDLNYSFLDTCLALLELIQNQYDSGFTDVKDACCGLGSLNAKLPCSPISYVCPNRNNHIFWDLYHPTEAADEIIATDAIDGSPPLVYPLNVRQLNAL